jgi:hypothetical protein
MKLQLPNVTAICLQGRDNSFDNSLDDRSKKLLEYMVSIIDFKKIIFISNTDPQVGGIEYIHTEPVSYYFYNRWCVRELTKYINTDYCLLFQDDGFPLNVEFWDNEFLNYDYVGAPLPLGSTILHNENERIGGGGFTLRSKKLLDLMTTWTDYEGKENEDTYICHVKRNSLINNGLKICPHTIARKFVIQNAIDKDHTIYNTFGFHGRDEKLDEVMKIIFNK